MIAPEVIAEQVMGYVVGATEMIPTLKSAAKNTYNIAIIPQGPHFYTGLLQAAGYLLLNHKKQKLIIISQQSDQSKEILIDTNHYEPIMGQTRKSSASTVAKAKTDMGAKYATQDHRQIRDNLMLQLPFIRTIKKTKEFVHISIGNDVSSQKTKKIITWIHNLMGEYSVILLANIDIPGGSTSHKKTDEQKEIIQSIQTGTTDNRLINIFHILTKKTHIQPEIIAYIKPQKTEKPTETKTRYICAVG